MYVDEEIFVCRSQLTKFMTYQYNDSEMNVKVHVKMEIEGKIVFK